MKKIGAILITAGLGLIGFGASASASSTPPDGEGILVGYPPCDATVTGESFTVTTTPFNGTVAPNDTTCSGTYALVTGPTTGSVSLAPNGTFTYTAPAGTSGTFTFTYTLNFPSSRFGLVGLLATATLNVNIPATTTTPAPTTTAAVTTTTALASAAPTTTVAATVAPTTTAAATTTTALASAAPTTTAAIPVSTLAGGLPKTGSDSSSMLQIGVVALLTGIGLVGITAARRRKPLGSAI